MRLSRAEYLRRYGPTVGDRVRLADTDLWVRVEADRAEAGDEPMWGYAKNLRSRQAQFDRAAADGELDMVVTGVLVVDPLLGVVKTDLGIKDGRIVGAGRAGNPETTPGVELVIGPNTWPVNGYGLIATAGAIDSHVHLITPRLVPVALAGGVTTLITAGFEEPPYVMERTYLAFEDLPVNLGLQASARTDLGGPVERVLDAGACGLKIHEDWGAYPEVVDAVLDVAEAHDVPVCLHTDGLNESCELDDTVAAIGGRTVHAYHVEGVGGGHVPDLIAIVREPNVICSSTTPTLPYGTATGAEHLEMILAVHGGSVAVPEDVEAALDRIHPATMAAEGPLHELGAIQIVNSDSQGMGRIGETLRRTFQLAHAMKRWRGLEQGSGWPDAPTARRQVPASVVPVDGTDDNERVLRYLAKVTVEPAIVHGVADEVGSLAPGRLADVVLWRPERFGVRPELVLKAGAFAWGALGQGNASVEGAQPVRQGPHWGATGRAGGSIATTFVSRIALDGGIRERLGSRRRFVAVHDTRGIGRDALVANRAAPVIEVDPSDGRVTLEGRVLAADPVDEVPLSRRYLLA
ncbi:MAG TPA: urease subunit alpha [Actinomycetota bacterium]|nr:urease subunit alpha [Actinomycetota bacterium]